MMYVAWFVEFVLESAGAYCFFRRKTILMSLFLGLRAVADLLGALALKLISFRAYAWVDYISRNVSYVLFAAVCLWVVAQILDEPKRTRKFYALAGPLIVLAAVLKFHSFPVTMKTAMVFEAWLGMILGACVAVAMAISCYADPIRPGAVKFQACARIRPPQLSSHWSLIALGLTVQAGTDAAITIGRTHGFQLEAYYPLGAIVSLGILSVAGFRDWRLKEVSISLGMKKPPTSVLVPRKVQSRVM